MTATPLSAFHDLATAGLGSAWHVHETGRTWTLATPPGDTTTERRQGWKLHVAATTHNASRVLRLVCRILAANPTTFKFASSPPVLEQLNDFGAARESSGKFITIYPEDEAACVRLGHLLADELDGEPGPVILSDGRVRETAPVFYRFGGFTPPSRFRPDGTLATELIGPDGQAVEDRRVPWFYTPSWAIDPFTRVARRPEPRASSGMNVMLRSRYLVARAIRHANRGGVYVALDVDTGIRVVIKEARPEIGRRAQRAGDAVEVLQHEVAMLRRYAHLPVAVLVEDFWQSGNYYAVVEHLPGENLTAYAARTLTDPVETKLAVASSLCRNVGICHEHGLALRDLSPNNVMITDDECTFIDLELAHELGHRPKYLPDSGTPGFVSPEQLASRHGSVQADLFSLAAVLCYLFTGTTIGVARGRDLAGALADWLHALNHLGLLGADTTDVLLRLARGGFPSAELARQALTGPPGPAPGNPSTVRPDGKAGEWAHVATERIERTLLENTVEWLTGVHERAAGDLPTALSAHDQDHLNVQSGLAGPVLALSTWEYTRTAGDTDLPSARQLLSTMAADLRLAMTERRTTPPPSLYFGEAGSLLALAAATGEDESFWRERALRLPSALDLPDVCHGTAGLVLAHLSFWRATGDAQHLRKSSDGADQLLNSAQERAGQICWPIAETVESAMAGKTYTGFAHGTAGVATALLVHGAHTGTSAATELGLTALRRLGHLANRIGERAYWPNELDGPGTRDVYWCNGSVGIGRALVKAWQASGDPDLLSLAYAAAEAGSFDFLRLGPARCHGLLGLLDLWLDLREVDAQRAGQAIEAILLVMTHRSVIDHELSVLPDESGKSPTIGFNTGTSGTLTTMLRCVHHHVPDLLLGEWFPSGS